MAITTERSVDPSRSIVRVLGGVLERGEPIGYLAMRVWFAITLFTHGLPKLLNVPHGEGPPAFDQLVAVIGGKMQLPFAEPFAVLITALETVGALLLALGLGTRIVAAIVTVELVAAAVGVHWPVWVWTARGMEYPLLMAVLAAYLAMRGGGRWSLDRRFRLDA